MNSIVIRLNHLSKSKNNYKVDINNQNGANVVKQPNIIATWVILTFIGYFDYGSFDHK